MTFDIHQQIFDEDGTPLEPEAEEYQNELLELFGQSPEAQALWDDGLEGGWAGMMLDLGKNYLGVAPPQMSASDMREILFDLIPRKISAPADEAPEIVREFQAFWRFMQREFHLENATACLSVLNDKAVHELKKQMSNPANFGMAKSLVMMGMERGFDMQSEEGLNEWMRTYNAELAAGTGTPVTLPGERSMSRQDLASRIHILGKPGQNPRSSHNKQKSRMAKASRKKNRKRR